MKNFFAFDRKSKDTHNRKFVLRELDGTVNSRFNEISERNRTAEKKALLPLWIALIMPLCAIAGLLMISFGIPDAGEQLTNTRFALLITGGILTLAGSVLFLIQHFKMKKLKQNSYYNQSVEEENKLAEEVLKVPETAEKADILIADREVKNPSYRMAEMKIFKENDLLCFSDGKEVTGVPLSQIMTCYIINKKTRFWTMEDLTKAQMAEKGIKRSALNANSSGTYVIPSRTVMELQLEGGQMEIVVPCYDSDKVLKYLNKNVVII